MVTRQRAQHAVSRCARGGLAAVPVTPGAYGVVRARVSVGMYLCQSEQLTLPVHIITEDRDHGCSMVMYQQQHIVGPDLNQNGLSRSQHPHPEFGG